MHAVKKIPEDTILHSHHRENLKSYILLPLLHVYLVHLLHHASHLLPPL
jgi:hypothetical protein